MMRMDISTKVGKLHLKNPVMPASGTWGYGEEYLDFVVPEELGAVVVKGTTIEPREGNAPPRLAETPAGLLNCVGLQNVGLEKFIKEKLPVLKERKAFVIVNIAGNTVDDYRKISSALKDEKPVSAIEVNISCPNVKEGGISFGVNPDSAARVIKAVRKECPKPVIAKLTPNVSDIVSIAKACLDAGADAVTLINTLKGIAIDTANQKPLLPNITGGLSGPAIKPVALAMVYEVKKATGAAIIGVGGIESFEDALEFIMAGASAVQIGTANFYNPNVMPEIIKGFEEYFIKNGIKSMEELIGAAVL
ncbi:MAG: dihydroorotate dehydrogenase [Candidatus Aureabacteria bacterium]|nr:dihydroorotate dehydrogenase [Candidatus Auribacterota bacterium]